MSDNKTGEASSPVGAYLAAIDDAGRRADCIALVALLGAATGCQPTMWGDSIVGFGRYHYRYESGREGDGCLVGFSSRKGDISVYLAPALPERDAVLGRLGRHKAGKGCIYLRRLADVDVTVLAELATASVAELRRRYP